MARNAYSSGASSVRRSIACRAPSEKDTTPLTSTARRRSIRAGVLRARCASDRTKRPDRSEHRRERQRPGLGHVRGEHGERTPAGGEPDVVVDDPAEELEVVPDHEHGSEHEERDQRPPDLDDPGDAEGDGTREADRGHADESAAGDVGAQRPAVQLVERVGRHARRRGRRPAAWRSAASMLTIGARHAPMTT